MQQFIGDCGWLDEELVRRFGQTFTHSRTIDHSIDQNVGDVDTAWAEITRNQFRKNPLRCLGRGKAEKFALPRMAEVLPVTRMVPLPALIMSGATSRARYNKPITFT